MNARRAAQAERARERIAEHNATHSDPWAGWTLGWVWVSTEALITGEPPITAHLVVDNYDRYTPCGAFKAERNEAPRALSIRHARFICLPCRPCARWLASRGAKP